MFAKRVLQVALLLGVVGAIALLTSGIDRDITYVESIEWAGFQFAGFTLTIGLLAVAAFSALFVLTTWLWTKETVHETFDRSGLIQDRRTVIQRHHE